MATKVPERRGGLDQRGSIATLRREEGGKNWISEKEGRERTSHAGAARVSACGLEPGLDDVEGTGDDAAHEPGASAGEHGLGAPEPRYMRITVTQRHPHSCTGRRGGSTGWRQRTRRNLTIRAQQLRIRIGAGSVKARGDGIQDRFIARVRQEAQSKRRDATCAQQRIRSRDGTH